MRVLRLLAQLIIVAIPIGLFTWLLVMDIAPSGERITVWSTDTATPFIDRLLPDDRVVQTQEVRDGHSFVSIVEQPVYFGLHLPHTTFPEMDVQLTFANLDQPIVELGALVDIPSQSYELQPLHNQLIEALDWEVIEQDGVYLHQRELRHGTFSSFYEDLPERTRIAVYHADLEAPFRLSDYSPLGSRQSFDVSLRGYHKYVTYIKDETFDLQVAWMDMNRTSGADEGVIRVRDEQGEVVYEHFYEDDGNVTENQISADANASIVLSDLPEGVYAVELLGTSDIFWRSFDTSQRYLSFVNKINIADDVGHLPEPTSTTFYTNAKHLTAQTLHGDSTQRIALGTDEIVVDQTHEKIFYAVEDVGVVQGISPVGDVEIVGDGKFAFSQGSFFDPDPIKMNAYTDVDVQGIDYILTTYESPEVHGEWLVANATFDLETIRALSEQKMTISVPGIEAFQGMVDVAEIQITFMREPLDWRGFFSAVRDRLPFGL